MARKIVRMDARWKYGDGTSKKVVKHCRQTDDGKYRPRLCIGIKINPAISFSNIFIFNNT